MEAIITTLRETAADLAAVGTYYADDARNITRIAKRLENSLRIANGITPITDEEDDE
ncbi:hypothetical protein [Neoaquamicrobium microcysteis]|uniref:hypothetical protein n=1 Tax=Neoaquamicrobium microcysteis TaxID=2682781 RepID=UPI0013763D35|nr:hypothetical protein [Mesorhizobium microcysteis]